MWTYLWALYSVTLTYVSVSLPVPLSPDDYSFIVSPNSERLIHPISFLIFKFMLAILVPLPFQINFRISIPILTKKNPAWILLELHYISRSVWGELGFCPVESLPIYEQSMFISIGHLRYFQQCLVVSGFFLSFLSLYLLSLLSGTSSTWYWIGVVRLDILALFPVLMRNHLVFHH